MWECMYMPAIKNCISVCNYLFSRRILSDAVQPQCNWGQWSSFNWSEIQYYFNSWWQCWWRSLREHHPVFSHYTTPSLTHLFPSSVPPSVSLRISPLSCYLEPILSSSLLSLAPLWSSPDTICWWGALPYYYLQGNAWHCCAHKGQQRERDGLKAREKKKRTKSSYMKDKNEEDEKIKG